MNNWTLPCRYCGRKSAQARSRGCHEARCPALKRIPNAVALYRKTLESIRQRLLADAVTKGQGKALAEIIRELLQSHP